MNAPTRSIAIACADAFFAGMMLYLAIQGFMSGDNYAWVAVGFILFFLWRAVTTIYKINNFINVTAEMMDSLALYIFDGNEDSVNRVLNLIISNKTGQPVNEVIMDAIRKTKSETASDTE